MTYLEKMIMEVILEIELHPLSRQLSEESKLAAFSRLLSGEKTNITESLKEEIAIANSIGSGNIEGMGTGDDEPGVDMKKRKKKSPILGSITRKRP